MDCRTSGLVQLVDRWGGWTSGLSVSPAVQSVHSVQQFRWSMSPQFMAQGQWIFGGHHPPTRPASSSVRPVQLSNQSTSPPVHSSSASRSLSPMKALSPSVHPSINPPSKAQTKRIVEGGQSADCASWNLFRCQRRPTKLWWLKTPSVRNLTPTGR